MTRPQRWILSFVLAVVRRPRATLAVTLLVAFACIGLAVLRLRISTDQNKLFSTRVPFFRAYVEFDRQFPENEEVFVVIQARGDERAVPVARWTAAADAVAERVGRLSGQVVRASAQVPIDQLGEQALLLEAPERLRGTVEEARRFVGFIRIVAAKPDPITGFLLGTTPLERMFASLQRAASPEETAPLLGEVARSLNATLSAPPGTKPGKAVRLPDLAALDAADPGRLGYFWQVDQSDRSRHLLLVRVVPKHDYSSLTAIADTIDTIRAAVAEAGGPFGEFTFGVTGRPALAADEMRTTDRDSHRAEAVALTAVFIGLVALLRSFWLALAAELALGVGVAWTFGWATLTLGELNLLSIVFLLALIGIGMDYLVQILSRYKAEAARRGSARAVWVAVFRQVGPPINTACLGAAGAFLVSLFTDFRGAADLGLIAGGGLLLCLLAGYTFLPALLTVWPGKGRNREAGSGKREARSASPPPFPTRRSSSQAGVVGEGVSRRWFLGPLVWLGLLTVALLLARRTGFNPDLLGLQAQNLESVQLVRKLQTWSAVVLSKDLDALRAARAALSGSAVVERTDGALNMWDNHEALTKQIPPLPAVAWATPAPVLPEWVPKVAARAEALSATLSAKLSAAGASPETRSAAAALKSFAALARQSDPASAAARLSAWQVAFVGQLRETLGQFSPPPPDLSKLPRDVRDHYVSADGTFAMYVYPKEDLWRADALGRFIEDVERRVTSIGRLVTLTGIAHNIHHSTWSIRSSFYRSTLYALGLILALVWIDLRSIRHTLLAVSVLALGLPMLVGLMGLFGVDWNFANFFGLPILIGAGHEYGVFMVHRYRESLRDPRRGWPGWDVADSALLLCAFVTSSCFGFFYLLAHHEGLRSLGLVMAVGTICIYLATVVAVRPVLRWMLLRRGKIQA